MIPDTMRAVVLGEGGTVELAEREVPAPGRGEVLVRMHASPINPNDLMFLDGEYEVEKPLPVVAGFEGSGTVVASGGGAIGRYLKGRRVACVAGDGDGAWAEYMCTDAKKCAPLKKATPLDQAAMLLTNPLTASVLVGRARRAGGRAFVQNAAAGALGRMIVRLSARAKMTAVNVVRRDEQAEALRAIGAEHVVVSSSDGAADQLAELCKRLDIRFAIDAVAGAATGQLVDALVEGGRVLVYGMLSGKPIQIDSDALVFGRKSVEGFTMYQWVSETSMLGQLRALRFAQRRLSDDLETEIREKIPLADFGRALELARGQTSAGKILIDLSGEET